MKKNWVFNEIYEPVALIDSNFKIIKANKSFVMMVQGSVGQLNSGKLLLTSVFPENAEAFRQVLSKSISSIRPVVSKELRETIKQEKLYFTFKIVPFESYYLVFFRDFTVEHSIHQQIKSLEKFHASFSESPFFRNVLQWNKDIADHLNKILYRCLSEVAELKKTSPQSKYLKNFTQELNHLAQVSRTLTRSSLPNKDSFEILTVSEVVELLEMNRLKLQDSLEIELEPKIGTAKLLSHRNLLLDIFETLLSMSSGDEHKPKIAITKKRVSTLDVLNIAFSLNTDLEQSGLSLELCKFITDFLGIEWKKEMSQGQMNFKINIPLLRGNSDSEQNFVLLTDDLGLAQKWQKYLFLAKKNFILLHPLGQLRNSDYNFKASDYVFYDLKAKTFSPKLMQERITNKKISPAGTYALFEEVVPQHEFFQDMKMMERDVSFKDLVALSE